MQKIGIVLGTLLLASSCIGWLFWQQDVQYRIPTVIPEGFDTTVKVVKETMQTALPALTKSFRLVHFYNPDCPCSKFNAQHINALLHRYGQYVTLTVVIPEWADLDKAKRAWERLADTVMKDYYQTLATMCGVYSTPQAVLLSSEQEVLYKGNYNTSRYCSNTKTEFVRLAIEQALTEKPKSAIYSGVPYGCPITTCIKNE